MPTLCQNAKKYKLTLGQNFQNILTLGQNVQTKTCFGFGFNFMV
jgi:hypothetical protein